MAILLNDNLGKWFVLYRLVFYMADQCMFSVCHGELLDCGWIHTVELYAQSSGLCRGLQREI